MEDTKKCTKCGKELPLDQFYVRRHKNGRVGYRHHCKDCSKVEGIKWNKNNPDKVKASNARWYRDNPGKARMATARWKEGNLCRHRMTMANYRRERLATDINYRLIHNISREMSRALKRNTKSGHTIELLGCSIEYLRQYLEVQFEGGMLWDNYGLYGWHIDHIIPLDYFNFADPEQQKRAWHYTNLRPLWAKDNLRKSNKIEERQLVLL